MAEPDYDEYEILYDWEPEKDEDLSLTAGEFVQVVEKHDHGWWFGQIKIDGKTLQGYFPRNYIKEKPRPKNVPKPPPRPASLQSKTPAENPVDQTSGINSVTTGLSQVSFSVNSTNSLSQRNRDHRTFSLRSLIAFDELSQQGFTVDIKESDKGMTGESPIVNSLVELKIVGMVWDGAHTFTNTFIEGPFRFVVGKHNVVAGVQLGVQSLVRGQHATITCSPNMAYGIAGNPPFVPPNAFIVFEVEVLAMSNPPNYDTLEYDGPSELLASGIAATRVMKSQK